MVLVVRCWVYDRHTPHLLRSDRVYVEESLADFHFLVKPVGKYQPARARGDSPLQHRAYFELPAETVLEKARAVRSQSLATADELESFRAHR